jgi:hypothetical protein
MVGTSISSRGVVQRRAGPNVHKQDTIEARDGNQSTAPWYAHVTMRINARSAAAVRVGAAIVLAAWTFALTLVPARANAQTAAPIAGDGQALLDLALAFARAHPRARGRFEHTYLDRARTVVLHDRGTFVVALPRARVELQGDEPRSISVDATRALVLVPDADAPLALSFRLETTPLPSLFAALGGETPITDLFTVRRVEADGNAVLELRPIDPAALVDRIWLELGSDGAITRFLIVDTLGGTHRIVLDGVRYPASIPDAAFALDVPPGAVSIEP